MTSHKVIEVIDGDTFVVSPNWTWNQLQGNRVRPTGYNAPEKGTYRYFAVKTKLENIILGKTVKIKPIKMSYDRLLCDVYINGYNLAEYFPEYQT